MTFLRDPALRPIDAVRHKIGDTDNDEQFLNDEQVQYELDQVGGNVGLAAYNAANALAAMLSARVDYVRHGVAVDASQLAEQFRKVADRLMTELTLVSGVAGPYVGGLSIGARDDEAADADLRPRAFEMGLHDNPALGVTP